MVGGKMLPLERQSVRWKHSSIILCLLFLLFTNGQSTVVKTNTLQVCEGDNARLECTGDSEQISIELANFGRFSLSLCNPTMDTEFSTSCLNNATLVILANRCNGKSLCEFTVGPTIFGDTCPGTAKYLEAKYSCIHVTTTAVPSTHASYESKVDSVAPTDQSNEHVKYTIENDKVGNENCQTVFYRMIQWPETQPNQLANVACPLGSQGRSQRMCLPNGQWSVETDLSDCVTTSFHNLQNDFKQSWDSGFLVLVDLVEDVQQFIRSEKLLGGDLIQLSKLLEQINNHNSKFANAYNRLPLSETAKLTTRIVNEVLQIGQREAWLDLLADKQTEVANLLLMAVQQSLRNVARGLTSAQSMYVARPDVLGVVAVSRGQKSTELPTSSSYDIEDRVFFTFPGAELNHEYELVYSSISSLAEFLMRSKATKSECKPVLMSKLLSTWTETRALDQKSEKIPLILSFATQKRDSSLRVQCAKWNENQKEFIEDGSCMILVHNSTQTICRCMGAGHYAVIGTTCGAQLFSGMNKESISLFSSCILVVFGTAVYLFGLSLVKQNQPKYVFIRRNFCIMLIVAEVLLCIWFLLPRYGFWSSLLLYFLHGTIFTIAWWLLLQMFQLFYSLMQLINQRSIGAKFLYYPIGYAIPLIFIVILVCFSGNFGLFLQGFQPLQKPADLFVTGPLVLLTIVHLVFAILTRYMASKRVGYQSCSTNEDTLTAVRNSLKHLTPLVFCIDLFCFLTIQFSLHPVKVWLWLLVGTNIVQTILTLRVLSFKRLITGKLFCNENKKMRATDLPKNAIFSPIVQGGSPPGFNFAYNDPYSKNQPFGDHPVYMPSNGVHLPHDCHCEYSTINDYDLYNNHYRVYQQNPCNPYQLQQRPPVPPIPTNGFCRPGSEHQMMYNPHPMVDEIPNSPVCHEHGSRCASLAALRLSNTQLYHQQQLQRAPSEGGSYETARSSSTSGTASSVASSGTFLLRMDPKQNPPIFLDDNN